MQILYTFSRLLAGRICLFLVFFSLLSLLFAGAAFALDASSYDDVLDKDAVWDIEADKAVGLDDGDILEASGNVLLRQGPNYLRADFARYHRNTHWVYLRGNVKAGLGEDVLEADEAEFDLNKQVGWLKNGKLFLAEPHLYFSGKRVEKEWGDVYTFKEATVTACDGDSPAWSFDAGEGKININGKARMKHVKFNIKDTPVMWTPYFTMTTKQRQSGLLIPGVGYSSRFGAYINLPIYLVVNEENDITLYENLMSQRGLMQGVEYRHNWDFLNAKGFWRFDYLWDALIADRETKEIPPLDEDGLLRTNHSRYWLRSKMDAEIPGIALQVKLDLDFVSDQNYLREFRAGDSGFDKSRDIFTDEFRRSIAESDQDRVSTFLASRSWDRVGVYAKTQYTQAVEFGHGNDSWDNDESLQRLPEISAFIWKDRLPGLEMLPLELQADLNGGYYWRRYGSTGGRFDFHPRLSLPLSSAYGAVIPSVGFRETIYSLDHYQPTTEGQTNEWNQSREMLDVNVLAETEFFRIFDLSSGNLMAASEDTLGESRWVALKHSAQPKVEYDYVPYVKQTTHPYFDEKDRVSEENEISYSLTNVFTRKREEVVMRTEGQETPQAGVEVGYMEIVNVRVENGYDFVEAERGEETDVYDRRPFNDIMADATLRFDHWISVTNKTWFSPYLGEFTEHSHYLNLGMPEYFNASFGFDFQKDVNEFKRQNRPDISILSVGGDVHIYGGFSVGAAYKTDLERARDLETMASLSYKHQCFDVKVAGTITPFEERVEAWVNLVGINFF